MNDTKQFRTVAELAAFLDSLHEMTEDGGVMAHKWEPAQRAIAALEAGRSGEAEDCTEPNRAACPRMCMDFCNAAEEAMLAAAPQQPPPVGVTDAMVERARGAARRAADAISDEDISHTGAEKIADSVISALSHQQPAPVSEPAASGEGLPPDDGETLRLLDARKDDALCGAAAELIRRLTATGDVERLVEAARAVLPVLADYVVKVDGEWGDCRSLEQLEAAGEMDPETYALREALAPFPQQQEGQP